ncbi:MAG: peptidoglycan editing factor PgeF [Microgenomates group bacterium]
MFLKNKKGIYQFEELKKFPFLIHGISSRNLGNCGLEKEARKKFIKLLDGEEKSLILAEQVHGSKIKVVKEKDKGKIISGVDGLITQEWNLILGVRTADCLPLLYFEPERKIIGVAHAGWRGVLKRLPQKMVDQIIRLGGIPQNILVAIGPHICQKCYSVDKNRIDQFINEFGKIKGMVLEEKYLNLFLPTKIQLIHSGIWEKNIFSSGMCTSCNYQEFFSYRKDNQKDYGEILSIIGLKV